MFIVALRGTRPISLARNEWSLPEDGKNVGNISEPSSKDYFIKAHSNKGRRVIELIEIGMGISAIALGVLGMMGILPIGLGVSCALLVGGALLAGDGGVAFILDLVRGRDKARYQEVLTKMQTDPDYADCNVFTSAFYTRKHTSESIIFVTCSDGRTFIKKNIPPLQLKNTLQSKGSTSTIVINVWGSDGRLFL